MKHTACLITATVAVVGLVGGISLLRDPVAVAQEPAQPVETPPPAKAEGVEAGIKAITAEYQKAFNAADPKAAAMLWTAQGEYEGADGLFVQGREQIEKSLGEFFKANPKAMVDVRVESVKVMSRGLATAQGVVVMKMPGEEAAVESRYSALHTLEDGKWLAASVSEWVTDPATDVSTKNLEFLVGEWAAKGDAGAEVKIDYAWAEGGAFLTGKYTVTKDGEKVSSGTQVFGQNPGGGLRSWMFDSTGTTSDGLWTRDGERWVSETVGLLPDGSEVVAVNVLIPLGQDAFTWQTIERYVNDVPAAPLPPVKVTRVIK